jgi:glycosyltransferase involved in cell wall biosynthesis
MTADSQPIAPTAGPASHPRLLMITTVSATLGFMLPFAEHFRGLGWRVEGAASGAPADPYLAGSFDELLDLPLSRSVWRVGAALRGMRAVSGLLERGYDVVHVHTPIAGVVTRAAIRRMHAASRPAVVYTAHGFHFHPKGSLLGNAAYLSAEKLAGRWTDRLVVMNDWDLDAARRLRIVPRERLQYMPGIGVDTDRYSRSSVPAADVAKVRNDLGIGPDTPLYVVVGELSVRKRPFDAVAALAQMTRRDAHLLLLGEGALRERIEPQIHRLALEGRVHLLGQVKDVRPFMIASTALVLASRMEGLPRCVMEALSMEVPVITTDCRGGPDLVEPDGGLVVPVGDVGALARAMDAMAADLGASSEMGRRGRRRIVERCDLRAVIGLHETLYGDLLAERDHPEAARLGAPRPVA